MHPAINPALCNKVINKGREEIKSSSLRMLFSVVMAFNKLVSPITCSRVFPFFSSKPMFSAEHPKGTHNEVTYFSLLQFDCCTQGHLYQKTKKQSKCKAKLDYNQAMFPVKSKRWSRHKVKTYFLQRSALSIL